MVVSVLQAIAGSLVELIGIEDGPFTGANVVGVVVLDTTFPAIFQPNIIKFGIFTSCFNNIAISQNHASNIPTCLQTPPVLP